MLPREVIQHIFSVGKPGWDEPELSLVDRVRLVVHAGAKQLSCTPRAASQLLLFAGAGHGRVLNLEGLFTPQGSAYRQPAAGWLAWWLRDLGALDYLNATGGKGSGRRT